MKNSVPDSIDRAILTELECDGRMTFLELSQRISLSANATAERMRRLTRGPITAFRAEIDPERLGYAIQAIVELKLQADVPAQAFEARLAQTEGVVEWSLLTGTFDYMLRVICADQEALVHLVESLRAGGQVAETQTRIVLRTRRLLITAAIFKPVKARSGASRAF